jgi:GntR family transcriptional regulator
MFIQIKPASSKPIYIQIIEQIKYAIASGVAKEGEQLLSVRELARQLRVNPNTVSKAYHELEREKFLMTHKGKGVYVAPSTSILTLEEKERLLGEKLEGALVDAMNLGLSFKDVRNILKKTIENFKKTGEKS